MKFHDIIDALALRFRESTIARILFRTIYHKILSLRVKNRRKKFHRYSLDALEAFNRCMEENGFTYTLAFGTLLGAIRERNFISHDLDIDVSMWEEDYNPNIKSALSTYGFELLYTYSVDGGHVGREETYIYKGVTLDIFYFYSDLQKMPYCCDFIQFPDTQSMSDSINKHGGLLPRKIYLPLSKERILIPFKHLKLYAPINYEEVLKFRYGSDYMIPNKNWSPVDHNQHIIELKDKLGSLIKYK